MAAAAVPFWFARTAAALCAVAWTPNPIPLLVALTAGVEVELVKVPGPVAALAIPGSASIAPTIPAVPAAAAVTMPRRVSTAGREPGCVGPPGRGPGCAGSPAAGLAGSAHGLRLEALDPCLLFLKSRQEFADAGRCHGFPSVSTRSPCLLFSCAWRSCNRSG